MPIRMAPACLRVQARRSSPLSLPIALNVTSFHVAGPFLVSVYRSHLELAAPWETPATTANLLTIHADSGTDRRLQRRR